VAHYFSLFCKLKKNPPNVNNRQLGEKFSQSGHPDWRQPLQKCSKARDQCYDLEN
jgi:hypothetical protein